jgi:hypothetical protein
MQRMSNARLKSRLYASCIAVLALGLCAAVLVRTYAEDAPEEGVGYVVADGGAPYALTPNQSKRYIIDLERFGGKAAVLFDEFDRWFHALWQGKALGVTIAWISVLVASGIFLFASWLPPDRE